MPNFKPMMNMNKQTCKAMDRALGEMFAVIEQNSADRFDGFWDFMTFHHRICFLEEAKKKVDAPGKFLIHMGKINPVFTRFEVYCFGQKNVLSFEVGALKKNTFCVFANGRLFEKIHERDFVPYLLATCKGQAPKAIPVTNGLRKIGQKNAKIVKDLGTFVEGGMDYDLSLVEFKYGKLQPAGFPARALRKKVKLNGIVEHHMLVLDEALLLQKCNQRSKHFVQVLGVSYSKGTSIFMDFGISTLHCFLTANRGRLGQAIKLRWTVQAAEALTTLKDIGILHGNLRSKHCFVSEDGVAACATISYKARLYDRCSTVRAPQERRLHSTNGPAAQGEHVQRTNVLDTSNQSSQPQLIQPSRIHYNLKIGGFDSAGAATTDEFIHDDPNIKWLAPESLWMKKYNFKSEVWSFGVLIWEIYAEGTEPFRKISDSQVKIKMSRRFQKRNGQHITGFSLKMPKRTPRPVSSLIESCWSHCQCCRPEITDLHSALQKCYDDWMA